MDTLKVERERGERIVIAIFLQNIRQYGKFEKETTVVIFMRIELHKETDEDKYRYLCYSLYYALSSSIIKIVNNFHCLPYYATSMKMMIKI